MREKIHSFSMIVFFNQLVVPSSSFFTKHNRGASFFFFKVFGKLDD